MSSIDQTPLDYTDRGPGLVGFATVLSSVATIVVIARFWARRLIRQPFGLDGWLCLSALLTQHVFLAAACVSVFQGGMGRDIRIAAAENPRSIVILQQSLVVTNVAYIMSSPSIKLSVLALYWRLFPTRTMNIGCKILSVMCIVWCIAVIVAVIVVNSMGCWHNLESPKSQCAARGLSSMDTVAIPAAANCIIDFLTLILPIREIVKLKISTKRKFKIGGVFLLGGIACAASLVRTIALFDYFRATTNNFTRTARPPSSERRMLITKAEQFVLAGFATLVEIYVAIIGACLPILGPVYQRLRHGGKRGKGHTTPRVARRDGRVGPSTHTLNKKNHRVGGHSFESLDYTFDDDSLTLGAYPGNHCVYIRSDGRNDMP